MYSFVLSLKGKNSGANTISFHATDPTTKAANPVSSLRTVIFVVTPLLAEYAILTSAATFPPETVLPYNLSVCVLVDSATSVPSSGCRARTRASCSVASGRRGLLIESGDEEEELLTCYAFCRAELQCF